MMWRITILLLTILFYPKNVKLKFLSFSLFVAPRGGGDDVDFARPLGAPKTAKRVSSAPVGKGRSSSLTSSKGISSGKKHNFLLHPLTRIGLTSPVFEIFVKTNMHLVWFWSQARPNRNWTDLKLICTIKLIAIKNIQPTTETVGSNKFQPVSNRLALFPALGDFSYSCQLH